MSQQCQHCANLSVSLLVDLAKNELSGNTFPNQAYYPHHSSFDALELSGNSGCHFCRLVLECFKGTPTDDDQPLSWPLEWVGPQCSIDNSMYAVARQLSVSDIKLCINSSAIFVGDSIEKVSMFDTVMVQVGPKVSYDDLTEEYTWGLPSLCLTISTPHDMAAHVGNYQIGRFQVVPDLASPTNFDIANEWLRSCRDSHPHCPRGKTPQLPTRVIDVGEFGGPRLPRLIHSQGARAEYVALSHCWGGNISPLLEKDNLENFGNEIPYNTLPANFQDAITIARHLGIQYLWIDSLCIMQDSRRDWELESKKMGDIYRNSTVTVYAIASRGSTHGILKSGSDSKRSPKPTSLRLFQRDRENMEVAVERQEGEEEDLRRLYNSAPLSKRGWTLQESVLSPRHIYYGARQLYWKCPHGCQSADGSPAGLKTPEFTYNELSTILYSDILHQPLPLSSNVNALLVDYYNLVMEYSYQNLTFDSDKLPAISGLAQRLQPALGGDYLAGLWSFDLLRGLLWYKEMRDCKHVQQYRAPSWSWAVTNDRVVVRTEPTGPGPWGMRVLDYNIILQDPSNPYGQIISGHLTVEALTMTFLRSSQVVESYSADGIIGTAYLDEPDGSMEDSGTTSLCIVRDSSEICLLSVVTKHGKSRAWDINFDLFLPEKYIALIVHGSEDSVEGLVLTQLSDRSQDMYERAGYFSISEATSEPRSTWIQSLKRRHLTLV